MSFGFFAKMDCLILDSSLLAIEKLGIVTKPGEACTSFIFTECFYFLPALAELCCALIGLARAALAELSKPLLRTAGASWQYECLAFASPGISFGKTFL